MKWCAFGLVRAVLIQQLTSASIVRGICVRGFRSIRERDAKSKRLRWKLYIYIFSDRELSTEQFGNYRLYREVTFCRGFCNRTNSQHFCSVVIVFIEDGMHMRN